MEKNTILAIVLSSVIIIGGMTLLQLNAPEPPIEAPQKSEIVETLPAETTEVSSGDTSTLTDQSGSSSGTVPEMGDQNYPVEMIIEETDLFRITFSTEGAVVLDIELLQELDEGSPISMVLDGESGVGTFNIAFGDHNAEFIRDTFKHEKIHQGKELIHRFSRDYIKDGQIF